MADSNQSSVNNLLGSIEFDDPRLYDALALLIQDIYKAYYAQFPPTSTASFGLTGQIATPGDVTGFTALLLSNDLRLSWDSIPGLTQYEIRYASGLSTNWNTAAQILRTSTLSADINPVQIPLIYGNHTFFIKAINSTGVYSSVATIVNINIPQITAPTISVTVIDNNVLLKWTAPTLTFQLDHYKVYKDSVFIGNMNGTFEAIFETTAGTFTYAVEALDIVGNVGDQGTITASVNQPPDYELQDERISGLTGTLVDVLLETGPALLCSVDTSKTWATHFSGRGWLTIQDQIDAGYDIYAQPANITGSYEEVIDYGTDITNVILTLRWSLINVIGNVNIISKIAFSTDNITYTAFQTTDSAFSPDMRYAKIRFEFTGDDDTSLALFSNVHILLDVKREIDSGAINALSTDVSGTAVLFNKAFKDIDSITLTVGATEPVTAIYDFVDIPNPTGFSVYIFDSSGNRASYPVSWKARGIV